MRAFSLLELLIVLVIMSLILFLAFPSFYRNSLNSAESFENRYRAFTGELFSFGATSELCFDFKDNSLSVGGETLKFPYPLESVVVPGRVVSRELTDKFCFRLEGVSCFVVNLRKGEGYLSLFSLFPSGETSFLSLTESQEETLKDKVLKGRVEEWFSYYSY
ncbi:prepilin-type N-terminal cleavage/methylation domain-containing protein [Thermovibrio sp.]